ncbi:MAG: UDP-glucose--hexose-1-phosphate uridylyltransferase [Chloroflexota bacterium]
MTDSAKRNFMIHCDFPHRRRNPLTGDWVLVSPHRAKRPWLGQVEKPQPETSLKYDPTCTLCPGNKRVSGAQNPDYTDTFVFDNDFSALLSESGSTEPAPHPLFQTESEQGQCRVVCFSPRHDLTLPELPLAGVEQVVDTWGRESADLGAKEFIQYVQVFENKGAMMGCSNPHPHSQIWVQSRLPNEPAKELATQVAYLTEVGRPLLIDYLAEERRHAERILAANEYFTALVPFWAVWPFEILLSANRPVGYLTDLTSAETSALANLLRRVTTSYDNLFEISFPYSMGFHQAPYDGLAHPEWVLHAHFYPPLLRSATVRKFMVGYEMMAMPQRDITPESAAKRLRNLPTVHYKQHSSAQT